MTALAALLGALTGMGILLIIHGLRATDVDRLSVQGGPRGRLLHLATPLGAGSLVGILVWALTGWPVAGVAAAGLGVLLPRALARTGQTRTARIRRPEAVAAWTEMLRDTMAASRGLEGAVMASVEVAPQAIRADVVTLARDLGRGQRLRTALREFEGRVADPTCDFVIDALVMAAEHEGRDLGELLGELARSARERSAMWLRVDAGRARTRTSVLTILGVTGAMVAGLLVFDRGYLAPYDSAAGQLVLLLVVACFAGAIAWLVHMARAAGAQPRLGSPGS